MSMIFKDFLSNIKSGMGVAQSWKSCSAEKSC